MEEIRNKEDAFLKSNFLRCLWYNWNTSGVAYELRPKLDQKRGQSEIVIWGRIKINCWKIGAQIAIVRTNVQVSRELLSKLEEDPCINKNSTTNLTRGYKGGRETVSMIGRGSREREGIAVCAAARSRHCPLPLITLHTSSKWRIQVLPGDMISTILCLLFTIMS